MTATNSAGSATADSNAVNPTAGGGGGGGGGGDGGGGGGGGGGTDTTPPNEAVSGKSKQDVDKLAVSVVSDEAGTVRGQASVGVSGSKKPVTSKSATASVQAGQKVKLRFKFSKKSLRKIKAAIERGKHPKAKVTVTATDAADNSSASATKTVKLKD